MPEKPTSLPVEEVVEDLRLLAQKIDNDHPVGVFCACCTEDAASLRDLAARYEKGSSARRPVPPIPYRKGGSGLTRLELLLLQVKAGRR